MIDDFLTSFDELRSLRPRPGAPAPASTEAPAPAAPRTAIAAGVMLAVSVLGAAPAASTPLSKSTPTAEDAR